MTKKTRPNHAPAFANAAGARAAIASWWPRKRQQKRSILSRCSTDLNAHQRGLNRDESVFNLEGAEKSCANFFMSHLSVRKRQGRDKELQVLIRGNFLLKVISRRIKPFAFLNILVFST
jgi:hypothetical protein